MQKIIVILKTTLLFLFVLAANFLQAQNDIVTYAGGTGKETFYDITQITDGTFLVCGYADNLNWIANGVPKIQLTYNGTIPNSLGTNRYGFILHLSSDLQTVLQVLHFPQGAVEDIRFMKTNSQPYKPTGGLYISCNTSDTDSKEGGYIIAKLDNNFVNGVPSSLSWFKSVWAKSVPKENHPWDVTNDGRVFYISGQAYGYDWSAVYCLDQNGQPTVVNNWRTHWLKDGKEWKGTPASANPLGGIKSVAYSGIVLKMWGRCDLRSWTLADYNAVIADENGGTKKGKWPLDVLFNSPCDPASPTNASPGYTGYSASPTPVYGGQSICIDKRNNNLYIGMNFKSVLPGGQPDFEPAVIAMDESGMLMWWSRLYHEITPSGNTVNSSPDQYVDALAIDYTNDRLVVGARTHGNNVENFWEGNTINSNATASGFQNNFTGGNGNIHISWLGKFQLNNGTLTNSTYMAELAEGTGSLGTPHPDPNLDGWSNPNSGWPNVNTTRMAKNSLKVSSNGDVCVLGVGRRTITTANAYQKMLKPSQGKSAWNNFVRVYDSQFSVPKYSSLVVGEWNPTTEAGGGNTDLYGVYKTSDGVICVGRQTAASNGNGTPNGNPIPVTNVTPWGNSTPQNESAILVYYKAANLYNPNDLIQGGTVATILAPSSFIAPSVQTRQVALKWNDNSNNETEFILERRSVTDGESYRLVSSIERDSTSFTDLTVLPSKDYKYRLSAKNSTAQSEFIYLDVTTLDEPVSTDGTGLQATYYNNIDFTGTSINRIDATVNFNWGNSSPSSSIQNDTYSVRWTGQIKPAYSETYTFYTNTDDGVRLWVNEVLLIDKWVNQGATEHTGTITLNGGQSYTIKLEYFENTGNAVAQLSWSSASQTKEIVPQTVLYPSTLPSAKLSTRDVTNSNETTITAYPNPAKDILYVRVDNIEQNEVTIELLSSLSQTIKKINYSTIKGCDTFEMNIKGVASGVYFLKIYNGKEVIVKKIIIE
ncbi:PA14 domain-containing protein [Bernardetia sp. MNP-M8]|uniref:PA14 domain-containing protein n=1 Tax=Bernardetia sp. MNP-M8 TaxID=3127470 RepID=UPI0030D626EE